MLLAIELLKDNGEPFTTEEAENLLRIMMADTESLYGCLELCDMEGRALLARVAGRIEEPGGCDSPYEIKELDVPAPVVKPGPWPDVPEIAALSATIAGAVRNPLGE